MMVLFGRVYGALISLAVFLIAYWFKLSFFQCTIIVLGIGVAYPYIQRGTKLIDDRVVELLRRFRRQPSGEARQGA
jgi:hypothetical protein